MVEGSRHPCCKDDVPDLSLIHISFAERLPTMSSRTQTLETSRLKKMCIRDSRYSAEGFRAWQRAAAGAESGTGEAGCNGAGGQMCIRDRVCKEYTVAKRELPVLEQDLARLATKRTEEKNKVMRQLYLERCV